MRTKLEPVQCRASQGIAVGLGPVLGTIADTMGDSDDPDEPAR